MISVMASAHYTGLMYEISMLATSTKTTFKVMEQFTLSVDWSLKENG